MDKFFVPLDKFFVPWTNSLVSCTISLFKQNKEIVPIKLLQKTKIFVSLSYVEKARTNEKHLIIPGVSEGMKNWWCYYSPVLDLP